MVRERFTKITDFCLGSALILCTGTSALIGATLKTDEAHFSGWPSIVAALQALKNSAWWTLPLCTLVAAGIQTLRTRIGSDRQWKVVQVLIDHLRDEIFAKDEGMRNDPEHHHRVTMFKYTRFRYGIFWNPWGGWMIPVSRSKSGTKSNIRCFHVSLDKPDNSEGVAGRCFAYWQSISQSALPNLNVDRATPQDVQIYAKRTFISERKLNFDRPSARSLLGIPLEANGKRWGVIVLDSHCPEPIVLNQPVYGTVAKVLNEIIR